MSIPLPPKRFESTDDPRFDLIRHRPWFAKLEKRRAKLPFLKEAHRQWTTCGISQKQAAENSGVDERELRDYAAFQAGCSIGGLGPGECLTYDAILKHSYERYAIYRGERSLRHCIEEEAPLWGKDARPIVERWEVDPTWYPEGSL
jgi:hypothetical protein